LEAFKTRQDKIAELEFARHMFKNLLPVGENKSAIEKYFNDLETLIYTTDHAIRNEEFDDGPDDGIQREYQYLSTSVLKERASQPQLQPDPQALETPPDGLDLDDKLSGTPASP
jgi:hypothetical protein